MARTKKTQTNPMTEMPVVEVQSVSNELEKFEPARENNVVPFTGTDQSVQNDRNTTAIDQFLAQYGIEIV